VSIEIKAEDFGELDREAVDLAGAQLLAEVADIAFHNTNPGEGWQPFAEGQGTPALIAEVRGHIERLEEATKAARRELAAVERVARLAAYRRIKAEESR
jgi:hypothetical protein